MSLTERDELTLGLLAAPGLPTEVAEALAEDLPTVLAERVTDGVTWSVHRLSTWPSTTPSRRAPPRAAMQKVKGSNPFSRFRER